AVFLFERQPEYSHRGKFAPALRVESGRDAPASILEAELLGDVLAQGGTQQLLVFGPGKSHDVCFCRNRLGRLLWGRNNNRRLSANLFDLYRIPWLFRAIIYQ